MTETNNEPIIEEPVEMAAEEAVETISGAESAESSSLEEQLAEARAEAARNLDGWQRTQAEFANARKRFEKQRVDIQTTAGADLVAKLLPILDDFERALEAASNDSKGAALVDGVSLVHRKLLSTLDEMGVKPIVAVGETFDPNVHEALMQEPSEDYSSGVVVREMRRGYRMGERIIRPTLVIVAE